MTGRVVCDKVFEVVDIDGKCFPVTSWHPECINYAISRSLISLEIGRQTMDRSMQYTTDACGRLTWFTASYRTTIPLAQRNATGQYGLMEDGVEHSSPDPRLVGAFSKRKTRRCQVPDGSDVYPKSSWSGLPALNPSIDFRQAQICKWRDIRVSLRVSAASCCGISGRHDEDLAAAGEISGISWRCMFPCRRV